MPISQPKLPRFLLRAILVVCGVALVFLCVTSLPLTRRKSTQTTKTRTKLRRPLFQECVGGRCFTQIPRDEEYAQYFVPRKENVNPFPFQFTIPGKLICSTQKHQPPYLVIIVPSVQTHVEERRAIRNSWGSVARGNHWPKHHINVTMKMVFLFGDDPNVKNNKVVELESELYGDVVQGDILDTYANLSRKVLLGLHWVSSFCPDAQYILKADEDTFVNLPKLLQVLFETRHPSYQGVILGNINAEAKVKRVGRWKVEERDYPFPHYPPYAFGNTYVISANIASTLFRTSEYLPYIPIEDAFITGILAKTIEAELVSVPGFTYWLDSPPHACDYIEDKKISSTKVSSHMMVYIWDRLTSGTLNCS